jgi:hypothetical protein
MYKRVEGSDTGLTYPTETLVLAQRHIDAVIAARKSSSGASAQTSAK